jgi:hypothetical protein
LKAFGIEAIGSDDRPISCPSIVAILSKNPAIAPLFHNCKVLSLGGCFFHSHPTAIVACFTLKLYILF